MRRTILLRPCVALLVFAACVIECRSVAAQSDSSVELVVSSGRALRVVLTDNTTIHRVGQTVTGRLVEPAYVSRPDRAFRWHGGPGADHETH